MIVWVLLMVGTKVELFSTVVSGDAVVFKSAEECITQENLLKQELEKKYTNLNIKCFKQVVD